MRTVFIAGAAGMSPPHVHVLKADRMRHVPLAEAKADFAAACAARSCPCAA